MAGSKGIVSAQFYTFSAANRTITFTNDYAGLDLGEITYITNIKNGVATVIYDPFDATKGGTLSGLTLTLAYNTTAMADTDPLQIITGFTPLNADPQPVRIVEGPDQQDDTALLQNISDNLDFLNLALDQNEGIQMNVREINPAKRDTNNAQIASDGIEYKQVFTTSTTGNAIDTTGYNSINFSLICSTPTTYQFNVSNDGTTWTVANTVQFYRLTGNTWSTSVSGVTADYGTIPITARYIRVVINSGPSTTTPLTLTMILRSATFPSQTQVQVIGTPSINIATIAGNTINQGVGINSSNQTVSFPGSIVVAANQAPTLNLPNAASSLATTIPYPIAIGGREQPYIGALGGIFRYITLDGGGRYILGGDTPATETRTLSTLASNAIPGIPPRGVGGIPNNMIGAQSLTVTNVAQDFGDTQVMLMRQILTELKILNQNLSELPQMLNQANYTMSDPQEYRNDGAFDSSLQ